MVATHNVVAVCAFIGLKDQEGAILKKTFIPTLAYSIILATRSRDLVRCVIVCDYSPEHCRRLGSEWSALSISDKQSREDKTV